MSVTEYGFGSASLWPAKLFTIKDGDLAVSVTDFGATVTDIVFPDRDGAPVHAVLGYPSAEGYEKGGSFLGATVGRYAGRIGGAAFSLGGKRYELEKNDGGNHLHGGFSKRFWEASVSDGGVSFVLESPDGDEGFPGRLRVRVGFSVRENTLRIDYEAEAFGDTVLNLTNHSYFNLAGGGDAARHLLRVNADEYAELGEGNIPTGRLLPVEGTGFDLTRPRPLSEAINDPRLARTRGLDHSFIVPGEGLREAAELYSPESGIGLVLRTTSPTVHIYTAGFLAPDAGGTLSNGDAPSAHAGVCLETQRLPDSPNKPAFPSTLLRAGEKMTDATEFGFLKDR